MGRLNSKYYRFRSEQNALNNVAPRSASGFFSRSRDRPKRQSRGLLYHINAAEDRKMRKADYYGRRASEGQRYVKFSERNRPSYYKSMTIDRSGEVVMEHHGVRSYKRRDMPR